MNFVKSVLTIFSMAGGVSAIAIALADGFIRQLAASSPLCPGGSISGGSCISIGILLPQILTVVALALILFCMFKKYFKYSFLVSFFALGYSFYLSNAIGWLYTPMGVMDIAWIFYVLLFLLGSFLAWLLYMYFVKLNMWLWLKLTLAFVLLLILPYVLLYFERSLYAIFYV